MNTSVAEKELVLRASGIRKSYGHVEALRGADISVHSGEVVALVGDNGAGKSTLVKVLSGAIQPTSGSLELGGTSVEALTISHAMELGVAAVFQDLALAPDLSVAENVFLAMEKRRPGILGKLGFRDTKAMNAETVRLVRDLGVNLPSVAVPVRDLSGGQRQVVAVARGVSRAAKLVILDEPTAALGPKQTSIVTDMLMKTRDSGLGVLVVSHDLPAVLEMADRVAIMRQGRVVATPNVAGLTVSRIVSLMLGEVVHEGSMKEKDQ